MSVAGVRRAVVVLISGRGTNMEAIVARSREPGAIAEVRAVISDRTTAPGLERARALGIETRALSPTGFATREEYDQALAALIDEFVPAVVALAGFMRILSPAFVRHYAGRLLNVHPSLLPRFRGLDTHARAIAAGEAEHGASVHFVTEELDAGPVIIQARVPVLEDDTVATLSARVQAVEHRIFPTAVELLASGRLVLEHDTVCLDRSPLAAPLSFPPMEAPAS